MAGAQIKPAQFRNRRQIAVWLLVICALVFAMVVLGGVTRLTGSGLSMVRWQPVSGVIPPLSDPQWQKEFAHYQQSPEYQKINYDMGVGEFKKIFWFEYGHRLLGRLIGLAFLLPFLYFLFRRKLEASMTPKLILMFALGGLQGLLGWYMVMSGLVDRPHVSQYRLTAHLIAAIAIYAYMFWVALGLLRPYETIETDRKSQSFARLSIAVSVALLLTILSGGFVAGLKAGFAFNSFPLMAGQWVPPGYWALQPGYMNLFENIATVQFNHRVLAIFSLIMVGVCVYRSRRMPLAKITLRGIYLLGLMAVVQVGLGISTLVLHVPIALAVAHQASALILLTIALFTNHELLRPRTTNLQPGD